MGHIAGKDAYNMLGKKLDGMPTRHVQNGELQALLKGLFSEEEAEVVIKMPYKLANFDRIQKTTKIEKTKLRNLLDSLSSKGLVFDMLIGDEYHYAASPVFVGFFEATMMKTGKDAKSKENAELLKAYMHGNGGSFFAANAADDFMIAMGRIVPHTEAVKASEYTEVLDHQKAAHIVDEASTIAIGICSCRHAKSHTDGACKASMDVCTSFGAPAEHMIRHGLSRQISREEMHERLLQTREERLVWTVDNVKSEPMFMCHCCGCCCTFMVGVNDHGFSKTVITSDFVSDIDTERCNLCGVCVIDCPIDCIEFAPIENPTTKAEKRGQPVVNAKACIGCGVCDIRCKPNAIKLERREQRVFTPEDSFERVILQCLERGTLQNQLFDDPTSMTQSHLRAVIGAFLKLSPVKRALMSDTLRSRFLDAMRPPAGRPPGVGAMGNAGSTASRSPQ
jgi:ferredoxin